MAIGFSTGSLAKGDFKLALQLLENIPAHAIELSALREFELPILLGALNELPLGKFDYISFHAPSKRNDLSEAQLVDMLKPIAQKGWYIIVHPDILEDFQLWHKLGKFVCIENMDKRKPVGRTISDLKIIFDHLPDASFCLDLAHIRQVDPTMITCYGMLKAFHNRLVQIHLSDVTSESLHVPLNLEALEAYQKVLKLIPDGIPVIIESPVTDPFMILKEYNIARRLFNREVFA